MKKIAPWLFGVYCLLCIAPYFVKNLNSITPKLAGIPFTVWSALLLALLGCLLMYYLSKHVWDSFDGGDPENGEDK